MKIINRIYIVCYAILALVIIYMQHNVWKLSARKYLVILIGYLLFALVVRGILKKKFDK